MSENKVTTKDTEEAIKYIVKQAYNEYNVVPKKIVEIFNNFYGEDRVDLNILSYEEFCGSFDMDLVKSYYSELIKDKLVDDLLVETLCKNKIKTLLSYNRYDSIYILVHFPFVKITNEHNASTDIPHLWAKIKIKNNKFWSLTLNRSEYSILHFENNYMHSHIAGIPEYNFSEFQSPCLGRGPITGTIRNLSTNEFNSYAWNLFCLELDKYVHTESIEGIPYHYLEKIKSDVYADSYVEKAEYISYCYYDEPETITNLIKQFIEHFINLKKLKFNFKNGSYSIGMSFTEYVILISNEFIKWYNNKILEINIDKNLLFDKDILIKTVIVNNKIYLKSYYDNIQRYSDYNGKYICTFKGKEITLNITDTNTCTNSISTILNPALASSILYMILNVLNYKYGRNYEERDNSDKELILQ